MKAGAVNRPTQIRVRFRKMKFAFEDRGFDKYWSGGSPFKSLFWSALSASFPPGEKFFIDAVRAFKDEMADDPEQSEEIREFCKQEGHHTYQHIKFNDMNREHGLDIDTCQRRYARVLDLGREKLSPMGMLAASMALEHFTAGFANQYLTNPKMSDGADPGVRDLWAWHAAEEAEHKATCFDVYERMGGGYWRRAIIMPGAWLRLVRITLWNVFTLLRHERQLHNLPDIAKGLWYLFGWRGLISSMLPQFFAYFRPNYHPWDMDNSHLVDQWQATNSQHILNEPLPAPGGNGASAPSVA